MSGNSGLALISRHFVSAGLKLEEEKTKKQTSPVIVF